MKVALTLLILGVLLAAIGVGLWVHSNNVLELWAYSEMTHDWDREAYSNYVASKGVEEAIGAGLAVIGGSMAIAGGVMMILKREDKSK